MTGRARTVSIPIEEAPATHVSKPKRSARAMGAPKPKVVSPASEQAIDTADSRRSSLALDLIRTLGRLLDDLERDRVQNANRVGALERKRGEALPHLHAILEPIQRAEHLAELELVRAWRKHPLAPWAKGILGVGEKTIARLVAEIGSPHLRAIGHFEQAAEGDRTRHFVVDSWEERTVSALWSYCGIGDPTRKRRKGMTQAEAFAMGNPNAKKRCWILGEALVKRQCPGCKAEGDASELDERARDWSPPGCTCEERGFSSRVLYNEIRSEKYGDRNHDVACVRCGPAGKPAAPGSPWSLKHQHEAAKRYAVKQFLKDLWIASRHASTENHAPRAEGDNS